MAGLTWRKATGSSYDGNCVEVAPLPGAGVAVRDSKSPQLLLPIRATGWKRLIDQARAGAYDR